MLDRLTGKPVHLYVHLFSCILLAGGLPASKIPLSLGTILIVLNLLLEADFKTYWSNLKSNRIAYGLWCYIAIEWLSLAWSSDWNYAAHDLRVKLPLYAIPLALVAKPLTGRRHLHLVLGFFLAGVFVTSVLNIGSWFHIWGNKTYDDIRGLSQFGSHIRYGLMVGMAIALCIAWFRERLRYRFVAVLLIVWWTWYTYFSQVISGYAAVLAVFFVATLFLVASMRRRSLRWGIVGTVSAVIALSVWWTIDFFRPTPPKEAVDTSIRWSAGNHWYWTDSVNVEWENGYPVVAYISQVELEKAWNAASEVDYYTGFDKKQQPIAFTLWRYMASKGLYKDSVGFLSMSKADVTNVENGLASVELAKGGIYARLYSLKHQLEHPENPNGHSLLQRLQYWKAARTIISEHWIAGVGAGDIQRAFDGYYATHATGLDKKQQLRSHNQYLTTWITSGILGFAAFVLWWGSLLRMGWKKHLPAVVAFTAIALVSFLIEDTLETQMGVTFIALFYGLFVSNPALAGRRSGS